MRRRTLLSALAIGAMGSGATWWLRDWIPTRGVTNPCLDPGLRQAMSNHPTLFETLEDLDTSRLWDCHVHLLGEGDAEGSDTWVNPAMESPRHPIQMMQKRLYLNAACVQEGQDANTAYIERLLSLLPPIAGARLMLMAFDYSYDEQQRRRPDLSTFHVSNQYAQAVAARHAGLEWICSVHPYREDALEALRWSAAHGARAVKWLPPAMGMDPSSARCDAFFDAMRELDLPLISHGGDELAVQGGGHQELGNPLLLARALEHGVRVVVAHCASQGVGRDLRQQGKSQRKVGNFSLFMRMMRNPAYQNLLYGDISAITQINRAPEALKALLVADEIHGRLLQGSDYPLPGIVPLFSPRQLVRLGLLDQQLAASIFQIQKHNPLVFDLLLKRSLSWQGQRFSRSVFETRSFFDRPQPDPQP